MTKKKKKEVEKEKENDKISNIKMGKKRQICRKSDLYVKLYGRKIGFDMV